MLYTKILKDLMFIKTENFYLFVIVIIQNM